MVYKIRNKAFFFTMSGYKNNYHVKVLNDASEPRSDQTYALKTWEGGPQYVRYHQLYRNISRKCKQYLYGNKELEERVILQLKSHFNIPFTCETPVHLIQVEPERRFANQGDRDYELMASNQHPYQVHAYRSTNEQVKKELEYHQLRDNGETPIEDQFTDVLDKHLQALTANKPGGKITINDMHEVIKKVYTLYKAAEGAQMARTPNGDFNDFLEVRRPFTDPSSTATNVKTE